MRLEQSFVEGEAVKILSEGNTTELQYLLSVVPTFVKEVLRQSPDTWKIYGCYWWNLQELIRNYAPKQYRVFIQFVGGEDAIGTNEEIKKEYDCESDMNNWVAAQMYVEYRAEARQLQDPLHKFVYRDGRTRDYNPAIGFMSEAQPIENTEVEE